MTSDLPEKVNLEGKTQQILFCNILANNDTFTSKLIDFKISAMSNFTSVKAKNAWIVDPMMTLPSHVLKNLFKKKHKTAKRLLHQNNPLLKIRHTYPTMMKLGTIILYLKIQKMYKSRDTSLEFC